MKEFWRVPFTVIALGITIFITSLASTISNTFAICVFIGFWLFQGLLMFVVTDCLFPRVIFSSILCIWSTKILNWTTKKKQ